MSSTFSPSLRIELIGDGDQSGIWGQTTNTNLGTLIEQAITGVVTIDMADTNYTMSNFNGVSDESRNQVIVLTGTNTAQRNLIAPLVEKTYVIKNSTVGGFAVQIIGSSGTGVVIPNGTSTTVYCDGTNFLPANTGAASNFAVSGGLSVTGATTLSSALTYGGVTLSNAVTGTGNMALSASPTFTGTPLAPTAAAGTNTTQLATTAFVLANGVPTGGLVMWPTGSAPFGFLLCTGTAVSRTTYAALFAIVGTTFGVGDGSTTFNLPNYTNRMPYGTTVGATGGSADAIVVAHTHTGTTDTTSLTGNVYGISESFALGGGAADGVFTKGGAYTVNLTPVQNDPANGGSFSINASHSHPFTTGSSGSSGTNANLPPYLGINFIIKT